MSFKVIGIHTVRLATYDFPLVICSNCEPVLYGAISDMRRYLSKNAILYNSLGTQMSEFYNAKAAKKTRVMNLPGGRNSMLFWHNTTDGRTDRQNFHIAEAYRPARGYVNENTTVICDNLRATRKPSFDFTTLQLYNVAHSTHVSAMRQEWCIQMPWHVPPPLAWNLAVFSQWWLRRYCAGYIALCPW